MSTSPGCPQYLFVPPPPIAETRPPVSSAIASVRAYGLETAPGRLPNGVPPLRSSNYLLVGEWTPGGEHGIAIDFPYPISIEWLELEY